MLKSDMEKQIYKMGEVAEILGESASAVRYWCNNFEQFLSLRRNAKGNRLFTPEDLETMKQIRFLLKERGMTLEGAAKTLKADRKSIEARVKALESLKEIKRQLQEVRKSL